MKHGGGSIIVWACFAASRPGQVILYFWILQENVMMYFCELNLRRNWAMQHDDDSKHRIKRMLWSLRWSQCPDLNLKAGGMSYNLSKLLEIFLFFTYIIRKAVWFTCFCPSEILDHFAESIIDQFIIMSLSFTNF